MKNELVVFEGHEIRRHYDETTETWWFSVVDIVRVLTQQPDFTTARKYWNKLKERLGKEGSQLVTNCHQLKLAAEDGKQRLTDAATAETLLRLVQSVPSPKAEPIKLWLARVGYERMATSFVAEYCLGCFFTRICIAFTFSHDFCAFRSNDDHRWCFYDLSRIFSRHR
jgi:hypothetical protein